MVRGGPCASVTRARRPPPRPCSGRTPGALPRPPRPFLVLRVSFPGALPRPIPRVSWRRGSRR
ncbi:hypothetical protein D7Y15_01375 [Corallococcus sp. AB030]|nr:hypothetical protein D7Y15_01375 [Corallococcus sp. AB030]RUO95245.1 hypothetical protein D7Y11_00115 [Corallococcus sp. AB018]TNV65775.1 hypothetical protein FH620_09065 [Corallococcus exiguus]